MPETFPAIAIGSSSKRKRSNRVLSTDFGDGYKLTAPDGLNTAVEEWDLKFDKYNKDDIDTITAFLDARGSTEHFLWTPPDEVTAKKWRQDGEYDVAFDGPLTRSLSVTIKRVYIL